MITVYDYIEVNDLEDDPGPMVLRSLFGSFKEAARPGRTVSLVETQEHQAAIVIWGGVDCPSTEEILAAYQKAKEDDGEDPFNSGEPCHG